MIKIVKQHEESFNQLAYAFALYMRQQHERLVFGGRSDHNDIAEENRTLAKEILPILERHLDEDLVDELNQPHDDYSVNFARAWNNFFSFWNFPSPFAAGMPVSPGRRMPSRYASIELNRIMGDFAVDLNSRRKRDSKKFTPAELKDMLAELEKDLQSTIFKKEHSGAETKQ
jgi:hypothetical protein